MKSSKMIKLLTILLLIGCIIPNVSAKPKSDYIKAIGKGKVSFEGSDYSAQITMKAFVTPGGYTIEAEHYSGTANVIVRVNLPDGTKKMAFKAPLLVLLSDDGTLNKFVLFRDGRQVDIPVRIIKNKVYGTVTNLVFDENTYAPQDRFVLSFHLEIGGNTAGRW